MSGYSKIKLADKLGIKTGQSIYLINVPDNYFDFLVRLPEELMIIKKLKKDLNFIHFFTKEKKELQQNFRVLKNNLSKTEMIWISWLKGASKIPTDVNENIIRETGLREGLVDVKVCSIDEIWSALKFVYRLADRK